MKKLILCGTILLAVVSSLAYASEGQTIPESVLWVKVGKTVSNSVTDTASPSWGIVLETQSWLFSYDNEGHQKTGLCPLTSNDGPATTCYGDKRDGISAQYKFQRPLTENLRVFFAAGPYFTATTVTDSNGKTYHDAYRTDLRGTAFMGYSVTKTIQVGFSWDHTLYSVVQHGRGDADNFGIWVGKKF